MKTNNRPTIKVFKVTNNFEQYYTKEMPSQDYQTSYIIFCVKEKKIPLSSIIFKVEEFDILVNNPRVFGY